MISSPSPKPGPEARPSRRGLLLGGAALLVIGGGCSAPPSAPPGPPAASPPPQPAPLTAPVTVERVRSAARGKDVDLLLAVPDGVAAAGLPVCLALHGRGAGARTFLDLGLPEALTDLVRGGVAPFAVAAVDGDHYWVEVEPGDDPQRMLIDELPGWLGQHRLRPAPFAAFGISMGGFGALRYARNRPDLRAVGACSAALFPSWGDAKARKVFRDQGQWAANEPLRHVGDLRGMPTGVWCGTSDPFVGAARELVQVATPEVAEFSAGAHNDKYWKQVLPEVLKFAGRHLA